MFKCNKCGGRVFADYTYSVVEAFCFLCGKRWFKPNSRYKDVSVEVSNA